MAQFPITEESLKEGDRCAQLAEADYEKYERNCDVGYTLCKNHICYLNDQEEFCGFNGRNACVAVDVKVYTLIFTIGFPLSILIIMMIYTLSMMMDQQNRTEYGRDRLSPLLFPP